MSTYNYQCQECEHIQEENHPMSGPTRKLECEKCRSTHLKKTFLEWNTAPGVIFNGPGWCTNDDRGKK